jgi:hypothetical protein
MKNEKFYEFVKTIAGEDQILAESVITAHQAVFDPDSLTESKLGNLARAGLLAGSLATGAFAGGDKIPTPEENQKEATEFVHEIQDEYLDEMDIKTNDAFKEAMERYNILLELDPKSASHFARILNSNLHKKLGIAPPIGQQMGETQDDKFKNAYGN